MNYCIETLRVIQVYNISQNTFIVIVSPCIKSHICMQKKAPNRGHIWRVNETQMAILQRLNSFIRLMTSWWLSESTTAFSPPPPFWKDPVPTLPNRLQSIPYSHVIPRMNTTRTKIIIWITPILNSKPPSEYTLLQWTLDTTRFFDTSCRTNNRRSKECYKFIIKISHLYYIRSVRVCIADPLFTHYYWIYMYSMYLTSSFY